MLIYRSWCCAECNRAIFTVSIKDSDRCTECAKKRYAWHLAPFGRARTVPRLKAKHWHKPAPKVMPVRTTYVDRWRLNAA